MNLNIRCINFNTFGQIIMKHACKRVSLQKNYYRRTANDQLKIINTKT